ncbi:MAG: aspartate/glutamate racemase family protein [Pseudomonadota bacterium]
MTKGGARASGRADVGILMLETKFPRIRGDIGNPETWSFPVRYRVVRGASPDLIVRRGAPGMLDPFVEAGRELVADGAHLISTSCGFLAPFRNDLAAALGVPVAASALEQAASIQAMLPPERKVGILTISAETLTPAHLTAAGVPPGTPVAGVPAGCEFQRVILGDEAKLDTAEAERDIVDAARALQADHPTLGAILFECTNMPPYKAAVAAATGLPVFSIETYLNWMVSAMHR